MAGGVCFADAKFIYRFQWIFRLRVPEFFIIDVQRAKHIASAEFVQRFFYFLDVLRGNPINQRLDFFVGDAASRCIGNQCGNRRTLASRFALRIKQYDKIRFDYVDVLNQTLLKKLIKSGERRKWGRTCLGHRGVPRLRGSIRP